MRIVGLIFFGCLCMYFFIGAIQTMLTDNMKEGLIVLIAFMSLILSLLSAIMFLALL